MKKYMAVMYELVNGYENTRWILSKEFDSPEEASQYFLDRGWQYSSFENYHLMFVRGNTVMCANIMPKQIKIQMEIRM